MTTALRVTVCLSIALAMPVHSQNLVTNGRFDSDISGWPFTTALISREIYCVVEGCTSADWGLQAQTPTFDPSPADVFLTGQCHDVAPGSRLQTGVYLQVENHFCTFAGCGNRVNTAAGMALRFHAPGEDCFSAGPWVEIASTTSTLTSTLNPPPITIAPHGVDKVDVLLFLRPGDGSGPAAAFYDNIYVTKRGNVFDSFLFWRNSVTGQNAVWFIDRVTVLDGSYISSVGPDWDVEATGDLNHDGLTDLVWRNHVTGQNAVWFMNGEILLWSAFTNDLSLEWKLAGADDFDGDGYDDLLWRNPTTGQNAIWYMNGATLTSTTFVGGADPMWMIAGTGDFNSDGKPDILWWNETTRQTAVWYMDNATVMGGAFLDFGPCPGTSCWNPPSSDWRIVAVGDFAGDGAPPELIFRNDITGENGMWFLDATGIRVIGAYGMPVVGPDWWLQGVR